MVRSLVAGSRLGIALTIAVLSFSAPPAPAGEDTPTYERDIKALLARRCTICHSARNLKNADVSAGLALDSYEAILAGTGANRVVVSHHSAESSLFSRLSAADEDERMPLGEKPLSDSQRALIARWIDAGLPRGTRVAGSSDLPKRQVPRAPLRIVRSLDVVIPTEAKAPAGLEGIDAGAGPIQLALRVGPLPPVTALAFRGDGKQLAVGSFASVVVWDLASARPGLVLKDVPGQVHALAIDHAGARLAVGAGLPARSGSLRVYRIPEGTLLHDLPGHEDVVSGVAFSPDGSHLASSSFDQTIRLWDLPGDAAAGDKAPDPPPGKPFQGHSDFVCDVAFSSDGRALLSASKDRSVKRIDVAALKEERTYSDHNDDVLTLAVHPGGTRFVTAGNEPQLRWWGLDDVKPSSRVSGHSGAVHQLAFSGDGQRLISAGADGVRIWDGSSGALLRSLPGATEWQYAAALSADGRRAAAGGWDGAVRIWDAEAGKLQATLLQPPSPSASTTDGETDWLIAAPSGHAAASDSLIPLLRWQAAGKELDGAAARTLFLNAEEVARPFKSERP